jgi:hypothetical protein
LLARVSRSGGRAAGKCGFRMLRVGEENGFVFDKLLGLRAGEMAALSDEGVI